MKKAILYTCIIISILEISCKHKPKGLPVNINTTPIDTTGQNVTLCDPDTVYFKNEVLPILISSCTMSGCHDENTHADGVILTDYDKIMQTGDITPGNSSKSDIYEAITENDADKIMPRPPYNALTSDQILKIKKWIDQGAKNNYCDECDTTSEIKYATHIAPIIQLNCAGCHSANNAGGGYDLTIYENLLNIAINSKLEGVIKHSAGYSAMPKNADKLSECNIVKIQKWIKNGALNN